MKETAANYSGIGKHIRKYRKSAGLIQNKISKIYSISIVYLERGTRKLSANSLVKIVSNLNISTDYLLFNKKV